MDKIFIVWIYEKNGWFYFVVLILFRFDLILGGLFMVKVFF